MGQTIKVRKGVDATWESVLTNRGEPVPFPPDAVFDAFLTSGPGQPPPFSPSVRWIDASAGSFEMSISAGQIATLGDHHHPLVIVVVSGENRSLAFCGYLKAVAAPGPGPAALHHRVR